MALKKCKKHTRRSILHRWRTFGDQLNVLWESITLQCKYIDETISLKDFLIFIRRRRRRRRKLCNSNITFIFWSDIKSVDYTNCYTLPYVQSRIQIPVGQLRWSFFANSQKLLAVNHFRKKAPSQTFDWVLNVPC